MRRLGLFVGFLVLALGMTSCVLTFDDGSGSDTTTTTTPAREVEPNDTHTFADRVSVNTPIYGTLDEETDVDFFKVDLSSGIEYIIETAADDYYTDDFVDTYIQLYDPNMSLITENDDIVHAVERYSRITYTISGSGIYYVKVMVYDPSGLSTDAKTGNYKLLVH